MDSSLIFVTDRAKPPYTFSASSSYFIRCQRSILRWMPCLLCTSPDPAQLRLSCTLVGWLICKGLPLLTRSSSPKKCENLNLRAPCALNHTLRSNISKGWQQRWSACSKDASENFRATEPCCKVPSCVDFMGRMAGMNAPSWGASCLLSRPASARKGEIRARRKQR